MVPLGKEGCASQDWHGKEFNMKRHLRLALITLIGLSGIFVVGRDCLGHRLSWPGSDGESIAESILSTEESVEPVLFTEWLAGDALPANLLPMLAPKEGVTGETMRAYAELHAARQDADVLTEESKRSLNHLLTKAQTITRLVNREIGLVDAASAWLAEDRKYGHFKTNLINHLYPGSTEIDRYCQRVIKELEMSAESHTKRYRDAHSRALEEVRELKRLGGYVTTQ
jgi:hypothetical protein